MGLAPSRRAARELESAPPQRATGEDCAPEMSDMARVIAVQPLDGYRLHLRFDDGLEGEVDFSGDPFDGVFEPFRDLDFFRRVRVDHESGTNAWPNDVDLDPDVLYSRATG